MSKKIQLGGRYGQGKFTIVSAEDFEEISKYKWHISGGYVQRSKYTSSGVKHIKMHRQIMNPPDNLVVDHINKDRLDNRRENLRVCTHLENVKNQGLRKNSTTGYKGVSYSKSRGRYSAYINANNQRYNIGYFESLEEAARAYDYYALKFHGEFAQLNFMNEIPPKPILREFTSNYRGVSYSQRDKVWRPQIQKDGIRYCLGSFSSEKEAAQAYNEKAIELFGDSAVLNVIEEVSVGVE